MSLGNFRAPVSKLKCPYCSREIAGTQMRKHKKTCPKKLLNAPIQDLNYGEIKAAGRLNELRKEVK